VASESDLRLIAAMSSGPVLHEPSGSLAVPRDGVVYRWAPE
jgi:hypothetical protein